MIKAIKKILPEKVYDKLWLGYYRFWEGWYSLYPIRKNKIFVSSYYGADYGDNGKYIVEELLKSGKKLDIVWQLKPHLLENNMLPNGVRGVEYYTRKAIYEAQTSSVWIDNARKNFGKKRAKQLYIQTWHGGPGIKRSERDVESELLPRYVKIAKNDAKMCDIMLSNSGFMTDYFRKYFWYEDGDIRVVGTPRNDILVNDHPEIRKKVHDFFGVSEDVKLVLYAPTFRRDGGLEAYNLDYDRCCRALEKTFFGEWKLLLRLHPNVAEKASELGLPESVIPATAYPDMQELLSAVDCLISDFSSSPFDYLLTKRPTFLYACDVEAYKSDRGFLFDFNELPFSMSENNDELCDRIINFDIEKYEAEAERFMKKTDYQERGRASASVVEIILKHIK